MSDNPFFDSNVLLYLASDDGAKANRAEALLADGGTISVQVLNEMSNAAIRKLGMSWSQVGTLLEPVRALCRIEPLTEDTYGLGARLAVRYQFSVYDAMIVAAALLAEGAADWQALTGALKERTGRKGKALFLPLRRALTGLDHGPDMPALLPLIGRDEALKRLSAI